MKFMLYVNEVNMTFSEKIKKFFLIFSKPHFCTYDCFPLSHRYISSIPGGYNGSAGGGDGGPGPLDERSPASSEDSLLPLRRDPTASGHGWGGSQTVPGALQSNCGADTPGSLLSGLRNRA